MIPTAKEYLDIDRYLYENIVDGKLSFHMAWDAIQTAMKEYAKLHLQAQAEAFKKYIADCNPDDDPEMIKDLAEELYPLSNIQ